MTVRQTDFWEFIIKKVAPVLSVIGAIFYGCYIAGVHFATIENNQIEFRGDIKDLKNHVGRLDTGQNNITGGLNAFKTKYNHDREIDSLKRRLSDYQNRVKPEKNNFKWYTEHVDKPGGKITPIPSTN